MAETGNITERPVARIFREMAAGARSGVLRVTHGRQARGVVFEKGEAVFAVSNAPQDQLDAVLMAMGRLTREQAAEARAQVAKEAELGRKLLDLALVDRQTLDAAIRDQVERILYGLLLWPEGEYTLDTAARAAFDVPLRVPIGKLIMDAARKASVGEARALLGPPDATFVASTGGAPPAGAVLTSLDGYLLSRISHPMTADEICTISGLPEDQAVPTLFALVAAGFVGRVGEEAVEPAPADPPPPPPAGDVPPEELPVEDLRNRLDETLSEFRSANHYEVLGIPRESSSADIKKAYYALAKKYHPDRYRNASDPDVRGKLEAIFAHVTRAYDTLKDAAQRGAYDARLPATPKPAPAPQAAPARGASGPITPPQAARPAVTTTAPLGTPRPKPRPTPPPQPPSRPAAPPPAAPPAAKAPPPKPPSGPLPSAAAAAGSTATRPEAKADPGPLNDDALAEQLFQQGMRRYESKDLMGAIQLWQEAVRKNPANGTYHLHLGSALARNPRWHRDAEKHLLEASKRDPRNKQVFLTLGALYAEANLKKRAEAQFRAVLTLDPNNQAAKRALVELGVVEPPKESGGSGGLLSKLFKKK
jgi:curved DNA-binding protein CbpA